MTERTQYGEGLKPKNKVVIGDQVIIGSDVVIGGVITAKTSTAVMAILKPDEAPISVAIPEFDLRTLLGQFQTYIDYIASFSEAKYAEYQSAIRKELTRIVEHVAELKELARKNEETKNSPETEHKEDIQLAQKLLSEQLKMFVEVLKKLAEQNFQIFGKVENGKMKFSEEYMKTMINFFKKIKDDMGKLTPVIQMSEQEKKDAIEKERKHIQFISTELQGKADVKNTTEAAEVLFDELQIDHIKRMIDERRPQEEILTAMRHAVFFHFSHLGNNFAGNRLNFLNTILELVEIEPNHTIEKALKNDPNGLTLFIGLIYRTAKIMIISQKLIGTTKS